MEFEEVYELYFQNVFRYVCSLTGSRLLAEEITQETFLKALEAIGRFDGRKDVLAWLFTIARNTYISHCRKQREVPQEDPAPVCQDTLLESMIDREQADAIYGVLHRMREPYKEVFTLRVLGEVSFERIGKIFGKSDGWARVTYYRARKMIAEQMEGAT